VHKLEISNIAAGMLDRHGEDAEIEAASKSDELRCRDDVQGAREWELVVIAISSERARRVQTNSRKSLRETLQ
jgi:hypothetical protein